MAIATVFIGFFSGWLIVPAPASYLFSKYGFNLMMLMVALLMLVLLLGVIFFSQDEQRVEKKNLPETHFLEGKSQTEKNTKNSS